MRTITKQRCVFYPSRFKISGAVCESPATRGVCAGPKATAHTGSGIAGLTLVELLVVITIIGIVLAASVPMIKPMLETNKVRDGADVVAAFLNQARFRAMEEGRPVGVRFERYTTIQMKDASSKTYYPYNGASLVMRQVAVPLPYCGFTAGVRVAVDASNGIPNNGSMPVRVKGRLYFYSYKWDTGNNRWDWLEESGELDFWKKLIQDGDMIQFDAQGPTYKIKWNKSGTTLIYPYIVGEKANDPNLIYDVDNGTPLRWKQFPYVLNDQSDVKDDANQGLAEPKLFTYWPNYTATPRPVVFRVYRQPQRGSAVPTMAQPVALPPGTVVDLDSSGMGENFYNEKYDAVTGKNEIAPGTGDQVVRDDFCAAGQGDKRAVTIMFLPSGEVDKIYYSDHVVNSGGNPDYLNGSNGVIPSKPIFLCVGVWERSGFWEMTGTNQWAVSNAYLPDEPQQRRNYIDMKNYWVTVFPKNGTVRVNRMGTGMTNGDIGSFTQSRQYADSLHTAELK